MDILIIKLGAAGDLLRTTSILQGLKQEYPSSKITWITEESCIPLLQDNELIWRILPFGENLFSELKKTRFKKVINLDEEFKVCELATNIANRDKAELLGFYLSEEKGIQPSKTAKEWFDMSKLGKKPQNDILKKKNKKTYIQIMQEIAKIKPKNYETLLNITKEQRKVADDFRRRYHISRKDVVIGINTGAGEKWPSKNLPIKKTVELIEGLYKQTKAKIILFGGEKEIERNERIISLAKVPIVYSGCGNDLFEFPALVSICNLFITSDTLGMHIAIALKRKLIVLFGPTSANEIELYGLGKKIIADHKEICSYDPESTCMNKIDIKDVLKQAKELLEEKASIIVTAYKEPSIDKCINSIIKQNIKIPHEIIISYPKTDKITEKKVKPLLKKDKNLKIFHDAGKGKSYAINQLLPTLKGDILIWTDGDVVLEDNAINEMIDSFWDPKIGCVCGRIKSSNEKNNMLGYWSHLLADAGAHRIRLELFKKRKFLECSGYLFAFRKGIIKNIPTDVAEDTYIPYIFHEKRYDIGYSPEAVVYVKNPTTKEDWFKQRTRTAKAHETLHKYVDTTNIPRVKSFSNEVLKGTRAALSYPETISEFYWTAMLFIARLTMWANVFYHTKIKKDHYKDAWERSETTKRN